MELATISSTLTPLALLACPVGMGLMMWMMMRGTRNRDQSQSQSQSRSMPPESPSAPVQPASLELLREEQRRLSDEIDRLEAEGTPRTESPAGERS